MKKSLSHVRASLGYTQEQMANALSIGISTYNQYENGVRMVPAKIALQICQILHVNTEDIFLPAKFTVSKIAG